MGGFGAGGMPSPQEMFARIDTNGDGTAETFVVHTADEQAALLRRLIVDEQRQVLEFVEESGGLEQLFLTITEGVVQ